MYTICKYFLYFLLYSLLGGVAETLYDLLFHQRFSLLHGFMNLPIVPIYGVGATLILVLLHSFKKNPALLFITSTLLAAILEFATSWLIEWIFKIKIWDYSHFPFNFYGRVSLQTSLAFGAGAILVVYVIHPLLTRAVKRLPDQDVIIISCALGVIVLAEFVFTVVDRLP